jgi:ketosteroid isomerase-like protein
MSAPVFPRRLALLALGGLGVARAEPAAEPVAEAAASLREQELAFARSMAERDFRAFAAPIADEAVFLNGGQPLRGKAAILGHWRRFFDAPAAPFSWAPELVEVLADGRLGMTEGPVRAPDGRVIARFYSVWRREPGGPWRLVFDNGYSLPGCPAP